MSDDFNEIIGDLEETGIAIQSEPIKEYVPLDPEVPIQQRVSDLVTSDLKRLGVSILENSPTLLAIERARQQVVANKKDLDEGFIFTDEGTLDVDSVNQTKYGPWSELFDGKTANEAKLLQLQIDDAIAKEELFEDVGLVGRVGYGLAGFATAFAFDPIAKAISGAKALNVAGKFAKPILEISALEGAIQAGRFVTDPTKTAEERALEGAINVAGFALLHGFIEGIRKVMPGGTKKLLSKMKKDPNETAKGISNEINEPFTEGFETPLEPSAQATEGALMEHEFDIDEATKLKSAGSARERIIELLKAGDTSLALALSKSAKVRDIALNLVPLEEGVRGDLLGLGRATPASIAIRNLKDDQLKILEDTLANYLKKSGLKKIEFEAELARSMHKNGRSENPAITEAAKILKEKIFDYNWNRADEAGVPIGRLEFKEGESYFPRTWELDPIFKNPEGAAQAIDLGGIRREQTVKAEYEKFLNRKKILENPERKPVVAKEIENLTKELKDETKLLRQLEKDLERAEKHAEIAIENREVQDIKNNLAKEVAELEETLNVKKEKLKVFERLTTENPKFLKGEVEEILKKLEKEDIKWKKRLKEVAWSEGRGKKIVRDLVDGVLSEDGYRRTGTGVRRERVLDFVAHEEAEPFINLDLNYLTRRHIDMMSREIVLAEKFGQYMTDIRESPFAETIKTELEAAGKEAGWDFKKTSKIISKQLDDLNALMQMVRGTFRKSSFESSALLKGERIINGYMHMTKMGLGGITQAVDFTMAVREVGLIRFLGEAFMQSIGGLGNFMRKIIGKEANPELLKDFLNIFHEETSRFAGELQQQAFQKGSKNLLVQGAELSFELFQKLTGMRAIDKAIHNFHGKVVYNYIQRILKRGRFSKAEVEFLSRHGISANMAQELSSIAKTGNRTTMGWIANYSYDQWQTIRSAVRIGTEGLSLNQKNYIVPKSFQKNMVLRMANKYKSYLFMLNRRVLISGINNKNANYLWLMGALFASESMAKTLKGILGGRGIPETSDIVKEGLKGSGAFGILAPGVDIIDGMTNGRGVEEKIERTVPILGTAADWLIVLNSFLSPNRRGKSKTKREKRAYKRITPSNNVALVGRAWNEAIEKETKGF